MRTLVKILILLFISAKVFATPQDSETLIYGNDTLYIDVFPLEILMNQDKELQKKIMDASDCMQTSCWRGHHGTWRIINDSLFLVKLEDGCQEKELEISKFFDASKISNKGVFANWFSNRIEANYGQYLDFDETTWSSIYEGVFRCNVSKGKVSNVKIEMKDSTLINKILKEKSEKADTMVCMIVDEYPILIAGEKEYEIKELKDFILKHIQYPNNGVDCIGSVYISFIVEKNGSISNKEFLRKLCDGYDEEAMKVIDMMTKWKPGLIKGTPVRTKLTLPLRYKYE
jgi:hypothetical protein